MKSGVACFVAAIARLVTEGGPKDGAISLLITGDEEVRAANGTVKLLAWAIEQGERFDACLVGEPTCPERLGDTAKIGRRGSVTCRLTVRGRQGHTAYPQRADNAAHRLVARAATPDRYAARPGHGLVRAVEPAGDLDRHRQPSQQRHPGEASARFNIRFNDRHTRDSLEAGCAGTSRRWHRSSSCACSAMPRPSSPRPGR